MTISSYRRKMVGLFSVLLLASCAKPLSIFGWTPSFPFFGNKNSGLNLPEDFRFKKILNKNIAMISTEENGTLYALQADSFTLLLSKDYGKSWFAYVLPAAESGFASIKSVKSTTHGEIYVGTNNGIAVFNEEGKTFKFKTIENGLATNDVRAMYVNPGGTLFAANYGVGSSAKGGLSVSTNKGRTFSVVGPTQGLSNKYYSSLCADAEGRIFLGGIIDREAPLAISKDGGKTFVAKVLDAQVARVDVFCESNGPVHLVGYAKNEIHHYITADGGESFRSYVFPKMSRIFVDLAGRIFRFNGREYCDLSLDRGKSFHPFAMDKLGLEKFNYVTAQIAVDNRGYVYMISGAIDLSMRGIYRANSPLPAPEAFEAPTSSPSRVMSSVPGKEPAK